MCAARTYAEVWWSKQLHSTNQYLHDGRYLQRTHIFVTYLCVKVSRASAWEWIHKVELRKVMELDVSPLAGWRYKNLEKQCAADRSLFHPPDNAAAYDHDGLSSSPLSPSFRGCCWNPLTKCFLVCDPVHCCVRVYRVSIVTNGEQHEHGLLGFSLNTDMEKIGDKGTGSGKFMLPVAVDVNSRGEIAVADAKLSRVQVFMGSGTLQYYFGRPGGSRGEFRNISDLKFTLLGHLAIADTGNHRIQIMTQTGGIVTIIGKLGWRPGEFASPSAIDIARNGDLFVCDQGNKRIQRLSAKGKVIAVWGSRRWRRRATTTESNVTSDELDEFGLPVSATLASIFDSPTDIAISTNGEIAVSDSGPTANQVFLFSDTGSCRHVIKCPSPWQPIAINYCSGFFVVISRSPIEHARSQQNQTDPGVDPTTSERSSSSAVTNTYEYMLTSYPAIRRVAVGKLEPWPVRCVVQTLRFLTYSDAMQIRLVNHFFHDTCHTLRNEWKLFPLTPGTGTVRKYNQVVAPATGLVAVTEAFDKWGLRVFKPSNRIRRHVMDFESGFCNAISALYDAMFRFQHEEILRVLFRHHASISVTATAAATSHEREEIDRAAFVEIVTLIEEVRAGFLRWEQCAAYQRSATGTDTQSASSPPPPLPLMPCVRTAEAIPVNSSAQRPASLRLVESAQQHQMNKLLLKLRSL